MKKQQILWTALFLCLITLLGCQGGDREEMPPQPLPGTAGHYYLLGLETSDPGEKLKLYNKGLEAITDKRDTSLVALLDGKIYAFRMLGEHDSVPFWVDSLIATAEMQGDLFYQAKGYFRKSQIFRRINPEAQLRNAYYSRNLYLKLGDTALAGRRSLDMANAQLGLGDYPGSQEMATEALKYINRERDSNYVSSAHNVLGLSYGAQGLYSEALKEYNQALNYAVNRQDSLSYLHNIALLHKDQQNYPEAINIFKEITKSEEVDENSRIRFQDNYAFTQWLQDSTFNSGKILQEVLEQRQEIGDKEGLIASYSHLSNYYLNSDKPKSKYYAEKFYETATSLSYPKGEMEALERLISLSDGNSRDEYLDRYLFLNDSLEDASTQLRYQFAKIRFDEERKEQQINLLEAENVSQQLRAEKLRTRNIVSYLTALVILILSGALFYNYRQRTKREKLKQIYLTESRISKRIHDELANDIYHVMSSLEPVAPPPIVDKLEKIYQRTRDFSRENSEIDTGSEYLQGLLHMLSGAVPPGTRLIIRGENSINWNGLEPEKKIVLYRVLQEMMVNMRKHSNAKLVALIFSPENENLKISYSDNGVGSKKDIIENGNGIKNLKARLKTIRGNAVFETQGKGLKAEFLIPFSS
ncbi:ATP-binding protein [Salinimicrobium sp. TH3]|uniref:ATP-binding protein n=1 Tax=Salinimicrobium sp. TH3 TaxID=2997342 RepID=UPI0022744752|nr:ATP-binding protein [Salinimicrobium sp. TH3]MCY2688083.1 ATP-binding protein [Salinimicrobium sp. TH3]